MAKKKSIFNNGFNIGDQVEAFNTIKVGWGIPGPGPVIPRGRRGLVLMGDRDTLNLVVDFMGLGIWMVSPLDLTKVASLVVTPLAPKKRGKLLSLLGLVILTQLLAQGCVWHVNILRENGEQYICDDYYGRDLRVNCREIHTGRPGAYNSLTKKFTPLY